jgi:hypothetical protein
LKTNAQLLADITAAMADTWLAACDRRVIAPALGNSECIVLDLQGNVRIFGPSSANDCRLFIHRVAALDVLRVLGTERVAGTAMIAGGILTVANG